MQFQVGQQVILTQHEVWPELAGTQTTIYHAAESGISNEGRAIGEHYACMIDGKSVGAWPHMLEAVS